MRLVCALAASLLFFAGSSAALDRGVSGLWYNPAQSGHGFAITVLTPETASVAWYTYNGAGTPIWITSLLTELSPGVLVGNGQVLFGMRFGEFNPATNQVFHWGTLRVEFSGCNSATVTYDGTATYQDGTGFGAGSVAIQKLAGVSGLSCEGTAGSESVAGIYGGLARVGNSSIDEAYALLEPNGSATLMVPNESAFFGTYSAAGTTINFSVTGQTVAPLVFANGATTTQLTGSASFQPKDYITGGFIGPGAGSGEFTLTHLAVSRRTPNLSALAGQYSDPDGNSSMVFNVSGTGTFTGSDPSGCSVSGTIAPKVDVYAYSVSGTATGCGAGNGSYQGVAVSYDSDSYGDARGLAVALHGPAAVALALRRN